MKENYNQTLNSEQLAEKVKSMVLNGTKHFNQFQSLNNQNA